MATMFVALIAYTAVTISNHGSNLIPIFFGDMRAMAWPGQFNFDFMGFLLLSGLWVSWRHCFKPTGLALGIVAVLAGLCFCRCTCLSPPPRPKGMSANYYSVKLG